MRVVIRVVDGVSRFFGAIAAVLVIALVVLMLYDVVLRYMLNAPTIWGNDLNTWLMGASFVLSIAYAMSTDSHVRVDLLYNRKTRRHIRWFDVVGLTLIVLPTVAWLTAGLFDHFLTAYRSGERSGTGGWNPIVWPFKAVLFAGFAIFTVQIAAEIVKRVAALSGRPVEPSEESADTSHGV
jgi:TRAP-type mannitol/chloroaromatic compound transport system permease small subunit